MCGTIVEFRFSMDFRFSANSNDSQEVLRSNKYGEVSKKSMQVKEAFSSFAF